MTGALQPWHVLIILVVVVLLFGSKRLPDAARSLGRSMKILKAETSGLREEDGPSTASSSDPPRSTPSGADGQRSGADKPAEPVATNTDTPRNGESTQNRS